jgi:Family of unknown function (DUF6152)
MITSRVAIFAALIAYSCGALAHHSFAAIFDERREYVIEGVLKKVDWMNPHSYCYVDVTNKNGTVTTWSFEGFPPGMMKNLGVTRGMLADNVGKKVKVSYNPAQKSNEKLGYGRIYDFEGGPRIVFTPPAAK